MITSFFNKSRPIYFAFVFFIALLAFLTARISRLSEGLHLDFILKQGTLLFIVFGSILLLNFIVNKNSLTNKNNYEILLFSLFLLFITETTNHSNILISNFFVLFKCCLLSYLILIASNACKLFCECCVFIPS